jgi:cytochrome bd ubiquinol oxidase subunit II
MDAALPLTFLVLMSLAMLIYVVLDGYDLGVGLLAALASNEEQETMISSIGPFWDANETWLVLGVGLLLVAFPLAHGQILGALYVPVAIMLVGLILRGVAYEFRSKAEIDHQPLWNHAFWVGSLLASLAQGYMLGSHVLGYRNDVIGILFAALIAVSLCAGYGLLGATWLLMKTEGALKLRAAAWAYRALWLTGFGIAAVSLATPYANANIFAKWFALPNLFLLAPIPLLTAAAFFFCETNLRRIRHGAAGRDGRPFAAAVGLYLLAFIGLAYSLFPYLVGDRITYIDAASAPASLRFMLGGVLIAMPMIMLYTIYVYRVFWGRSEPLHYD